MTQMPDPLKNIMTEGAAVVACGCNNHFTAATVQISTKKKDKKKTKAEIRSKEKTQVATKTKKNGQDKFKSGTKIMEDVQITAKNQKQETPKEPDELYQDMLALPETGENSFFKSKHYKVSFPSIQFIAGAPNRLCLCHWR